MFCGCELSFGDPPNIHTCPICLGLPGALPVVNARAVHFGIMIGLALGSEIAARSLFHRKNYFYPDLPEGLPDLPVRRAAVPRRPARRRAHPPRPPRGGRRQADPPRGERADPRLRPQRGRLQPLRHAAGGDRHRARPALARAGARVARRCCGRRCASSASPTSNMDEGSLRVRRQRVGPAGGLDRARDQDRAQEHELVPLPGARRARPRSSARSGCSRRRAGRPGDAALRPGVRPADAAALQGGGARLPLLPRARPGPAGRHRGDARGRARATAASCPPRAPSASSSELGLHARRARGCRVPRELGDYFERALAAAGGNGARELEPVELANWIPQLVERIGSDADPAAARSRPRRWRRWRRWSRPRRSAATPRARC